MEQNSKKYLGSDRKVDSEKAAHRAAEMLRDGSEKGKRDRSDTTPKYFCTVRQLAKFTMATEKGKLNIVKGYVEPPEKRGFWHQMSERAIRQSLRMNGDARPLYQELVALRKPRKQETEKQRQNRELCIKDIEQYLKIALPFKFKEVKKQQVDRDRGDVNYIDHLGVRISVNPDFIFRGTYEGKKIIGGVRLVASKGKKMRALQHRIITYFMHRFLMAQIAGPDEEVLPELCLCIDLYGSEGLKVTTAPTGTDVPNKAIEDTCKEFAALWDSIPPPAAS